MNIETEVTWVELKEFLDNRNSHAQYVKFSNAYKIWGIDGSFSVVHKMKKVESPEVGSDQEDFELNYKAKSNTKFSDIDGAILQRVKITRTGWQFFQPFFEFTTAKVNSVYSKNYANLDTNTVTIKFFKLVSGTETEMISPTQDNLDSDCIMTQVDWKLPCDFGVIAGGVYAEAQPSTNMRVWVVGAPDLANIEFLQGCNLKLIKDAKFHNDGRVSKLMKYDDPVPGTNAFRIIIRHNAGVKCELMPYFEVFKSS